MLDSAFVAFRDRAYTAAVQAYRAMWDVEPNPDEDSRMWERAEEEAGRQLDS